VAFLDQDLILADDDLAALDGCGNSGLLQLAHYRAGLEGRLTLLDDDVLWGDVAGLGGGLGLGGLHLLEELEGVHGGGDYSALPADERLQLLQARLLLRRLIDGDQEEIVPGHHDGGELPHPMTHILHLRGRDPMDIDDGDDRVLNHDVGELLDLCFLPRCYVCHIEAS